MISRLLITVTIAAMAWLPNSLALPALQYDLYSETLTSSYFTGVVNQNRLRVLYPTFAFKVLPYLGLNTSGDYTHSGSASVRYAEDYVSPTAGVLLKPWSFLGLFAEYRRLYRTNTNSENDPRYGAYAYFLKPLPLISTPHIEVYAESVALDRYSSQPVTTAWLKLGKEFSLSPAWSATPYLEAFRRESPALMIGVDERSLRFGGKLKWQYRGWAAQLLTYRRFQSSSVANGWEALLVLSADGGAQEWN